MINTTKLKKHNIDIPLQSGKSIPTFAIVLLSLIMLVCEKSIAQAPDWRWAKALGGINDQWCSDIAVDRRNGDTYTTGYFYGAIDFDPGPDSFNVTSDGDADIFISKLDSLGNFVWAITLTDTNNYLTFGKSMVIDDSGNIYISGCFGGTVDFDPGPDTFNLISGAAYDIFVLKLDGAGSFKWAKAMEGTSGYGSCGESITLDSFNNIYTSGFFSSTVDFDPGPDEYNLTASEIEEICIFKLDSSGNFVWAKAFEGSTIYSNTSIAIDFGRDADVYTTGNFMGTVDFDPGAGIFNLTSNGAKDIFISKLDGSGNFVWAKSIGGSNYDAGFSIAIDPSNGNVYTTGGFADMVDFDPGVGIFNLTSNGAFDIFISKLDQGGNFVWAKAMGAVSGEGYGSSVIIKPGGNGDIFTTGHFTGTIDFDPGVSTFNLTSNGGGDLFVSKLDSAGNFVWAISGGGVYEEYSNSIDLDSNGDLFIAGVFRSHSFDFGSTTLTNADTTVYYDEFGSPFYTTDIFIAKLGEMGGSCTSIVTNTSDSAPGSLRDIISCVSSGDTITFSLAPMSQIILTSGEIVINKNLILSGLGLYDLTLSGNNASRIFNLLSGNNFTIKDLSLKNATAITNGGAIYVKGNLNLENVLLQNNFQNGLPKGITISPGALVTIIGTVDIKN